jgi:hypothetical protein
MRVLLYVVIALPLVILALLEAVVALIALVILGITRKPRPAGRLTNPTHLTSNRA